MQPSERHHPLTSAVLIGGRSERMGQPKHELILSDGRTMLAHVIDAMRLVGAGVVIVEAHGADVAARPGHLRDLRSGAGPLGGIEALLASGLNDQYLICPCDLPLVTAGLLRLLTADRAATATAFRRPGADAIDPLPARIAAAALPMVQRLLDRGERGVWRLMRELDPAVIDVPPGLTWQLQNANTPADLAAINARLVSSPGRP